MNTQAPPEVLRCCIEAPPVFVPKARHALRMLLLPLRLSPVWVGREELGTSGLYYGTDPTFHPHGVQVLPLHEETLDYFASRKPYPLDRLILHSADGEDWPVLFGQGKEAQDLVASAFFWLSGWQEHTVIERDRFGRFPFAASLQRQLGTALRPVVDFYRQVLGARLSAAGMPVRPRSWGAHTWALCPTHDIDYLKKWRPGMVFREVVQYALLNRRDVSGAERRVRLKAFLKDALRKGDVCREAFERMQQETVGRGGTATYFLKTGAHGPHDVSYKTEDPYLKARVEALKAAGFEIGLHPSFHAYRHPDYLEEERNRLQALTGEAPASVRTHYLRYEAPITPRLLQKTGFQIDSTLGFAEHPGFRHATCLPFQGYDIPANQPQALWEMPLAVMESALFNRLMLDAEAARFMTAEVLDACRRFGGAAVMLWHNTLWDELDYPGWGRHFLGTLDAAQSKQATISALGPAFEAWYGKDSG